MKRPENGHFYGVKAKWRTSCWTTGIAPRDSFVRLDALHLPAEFRLPTINWEAGLAVSIFPGGALEPFCDANFKDP